MLQCPRCDVANPITNRYCDRCGSLLLPKETPDRSVPFQSEYIPLPDYISFPPPGYEKGMPPPPPFYQNIPPSRPKITLFRVIRAILYFIAVFVAGFGLTGMFIFAFSTDTMASTGLGLFFWLGLLVAAVVLFIRARHRVQHLHFWPLIGWISGATVGAIMATILDVAFLADLPAFNVAPFILCCIILLYGLIVAGAAFW